MPKENLLFNFHFNKIRPDTIFVSLNNLRYGPFDCHFEFLETVVISDYSLKSNCNTSKLVDFIPIKPIIWVLRQKNDNVTPGGSKTLILTENDPKYCYFVKILPVWAIRQQTSTTKIRLG